MQTLPVHGDARAVQTLLESMKETRFIDGQTRLVILEMTVYSPTDDVMLALRFSAEFPATGGDPKFMHHAAPFIHLYITPHPLFIYISRRTLYSKSREIWI